MRYTGVGIPVSEMLAKLYPKLSPDCIFYGQYKFQVFLWDGQIWLRCTQLSQALNQHITYCTGWRCRYPDKFTHKTSRAPSLNAVTQNKKGRRRSQKTRLLSLQGVVMLMNLIGTPDSVNLGAWAAVAIDQYDYLFDESGSQ